MQDIYERAKRIKLLLLDVDGVLTDGKIVVGSYGDEIKNFDVRDGLGIILARRAGIKCAIITAKNSKVVRIRAKELRIEKVYENHYKIRSLNGIMKRFRVKPEDICFMGDDLIDVPVIKRVGLGVAVSGAVEEARVSAHYVTKKAGGAGAVREVCEMILKAQNKWDEMVRGYLD